jgi:serine/threonine-protein kinase
MSPEQCSQDSEIDSRSDIYAFGVILYEMLVGHVPFSGDSPTIVMMKHLQEPVPSVLEEREDLPASVARVVARAMAKVPRNRYQDVADLVEDLTIASGMTIHRLVPVETTAPETKVAREEPDEVTVVRPRPVEPQYVPPSVPRREPVMVPVPGVVPPPPAASGFNPLKIVIPAAVALLVVFGLFFVFNRNTPATDANANQPQTQTLAADPNSQPVQPAQPATGKPEEGLPAGGATNPSANVNASPNANVAVTPEAIEDVSPTANANANANSNSNSNRKAPALPEPTKSVVPETAPPPAPSATKPPAEKPSPTPTP